MKDFNYYLEKVGEIGFIEEVVHSIVKVSGLPNARPLEVVMFETGEVGEVVSLTADYAEVLILTPSKVKVGTQITRTDELLQIPVGDQVLGRVVDPLINPIDKSQKIKAKKVSPVDTEPHGIVGREQVNSPLETGVTVVDLVVPLAKGQRELVIGDRKTGKTEFLLQTMVTQASRGTVCIYAIIGQRLIDIRKRAEYFEEKGIMDKCVIVASSSSEPAGLIYLTPYSAMTIAEYFRDQGKDVLLILDDLTTHARYYREISLLAKRFPGRSAYPGDIFYVQARLIERAGNYKKGSITCLPVAESVLGDLSGYIQTNLMAMTDGHIFFDIDMYNQGKRPAVNPGLSVTRIGHQSQTPLQRDLSRELSRFLVEYERMQSFMHFGAEAGETVTNILAKGARVDVFFSQSPDEIIPINANILVLAGIWANVWNETEIPDFQKQIKQIISHYISDKARRTNVDKIIAANERLDTLVTAIKRDRGILNIGERQEGKR